MRALSDPPQPQGNIMIVDDNPANLKLLEDMLLLHGYEVQSFPRGRLAIAAADEEQPDLILLDINMPEMNGYEVCAELKSNPKLSEIPVVFLSALNAVEDKVKGFQSGGVDYISKPFQFEEVRARVETHLRLQRALREKQDLLEKTLGGTVATLWALVQVTSPGLALRSAAIRDIVHHIAGQMKCDDPWQYEIAATICLVGCIALPDEVFEKGYRGEALSPDEDRMFRAHPETAAQLLSNIPRLEVVAGIVRGQLAPETQSFALEQSRQGAYLLHLALQLDRRLYCGLDYNSALTELRVSHRFDGRMIDALRGYSPAQAGFELRRMSIRQLRAGMILEDDVWSRDGNLMILQRGTVLTGIWIERLENFANVRGAQELFDVRIPTLAGAARPEDFRHSSRVEARETK
jgi:CheY-like chemotaxis protein